MKVLIVTEGGKDVGFGHITRCMSIYQAFEEREVEPELIVNGDETAHDFVRDKNCRIFDWLNDRETLFAALRNADIAFIDSYLADYDLYEKVSNIAETAIYFDDMVRIEYPKGFVINGAVFAEQMPYPQRKDITYFLGTQYTPLRKEFWDVPAKLIRDNVEVIMITFGGADTCNLTPKVLKLLVDSYPELTKKVIIGKGFRTGTEIEDIKDHNTELINHPEANAMEKVMLESDIAISAGGQTLYELARVGLATIGVCVARNQLQNIEGFRKSGFLEYIGFYDDKNLEEKLRGSLKSLAAKCVRTQISKIGRKTVDGQGARRLLNHMSITSV